MSSSLDILNNIHKGLVMGMESISVISDKVGDGNFKDDLDYQYKEYGKVLDRVNNMFKNYAPSIIPFFLFYHNKT